MCARHITSASAMHISCEVNAINLFSWRSMHFRRGRGSNTSNKDDNKLRHLREAGGQRITASEEKWRESEAVSPKPIQPNYLRAHECDGSFTDELAHYSTASRNTHTAIYSYVAIKHYVVSGAGEIYKINYMQRWSVARCRVLTHEKVTYETLIANYPTCFHYGCEAREHTNFLFAARIIAPIRLIYR